MKYQNIDELEKFLACCEEEILRNRKKVKVIYSNESTEPWNSEQIEQDNKDLLSRINKEQANVYALFTAPKGSRKYSLRYIGQTKARYAKARLLNHLIRKHARTGAKLNEVTDCIKSGGSIKISWISVSPESLRHYVEEELIMRHPEADWNKHGIRTNKK